MKSQKPFVMHIEKNKWYFFDQNVAKMNAVEIYNV